jgi:hypothetical protein
MLQAEPLSTFKPGSKMSDILDVVFFGLELGTK